MLPALVHTGKWTDVFIVCGHLQYSIHWGQAFCRCFWLGTKNIKLKFHEKFNELGMVGWFLKLKGSWRRIINSNSLILALRYGFKLTIFIWPCQMNIFITTFALLKTKFQFWSCMCETGKLKAPHKKATFFFPLLQLLFLLGQAPPPNSTDAFL